MIAEVANLKELLNENKIMSENKIVQLQNDMRVVKEEWEKKCYELEHGFQREIVLFLHIYFFKFL